MCLSVLRKEFHLVQFRLLYANSADFAESPWFGVPIVLLYRAVIAVFCTSVVIGSGLFYQSIEWFVFLTNWSFLFVTVYFICATAATAVHFKDQRLKRRNKATNQNENSLEMGSVTDDKERKSGAGEPRDILVTPSADIESEAVVIADAREVSRAIPMSWFHEALWVIYNIASTAAVFVTIAFWIFFGGAGPISVITHGMNSVVMVVDTVLSSIPVRLFHVVYPAIYFIVYIMFTVIYWAAGEPYIYPMTDYTGRPLISAITVFCLFIFLAFCQSFIFGLYCLRVWIKAKCA